MISADYEVCCPEVLADDSVPHCLSRTAHSHGKREKSEGSHTIGVCADDGFVDTDTREVVYITGLGDPDNGVNENIAMLLTSCTDGQFAVSAMHRISGLEGNHLAPSKLLEMSAELGGSIYRQGICH